MKNPLFFNRLNSALIYIIISSGLMGIFSITIAQDNPWTRKNDMPEGRHSFAADTVNEKIYVIGGRYTDNLLTEYDPVADSWTTKTPMPTSRMVLAAGTVNGKIYAIGGVVAAFNPAISTVEEYDPATDTWTQKANMPTPRLGLGVSVVDGKIYAIGGMTSGSDFWSGMRNTVEVYDPVTNTWTTKAPMPTARLWFSASVVDGKIFVIGGALVTKEMLSTVEVYDPATDTWTTKTHMPTARMGHASAVIDGIIYVIGGGTHSADPGGYSVVEAYDPATDTWTKKANIPVARAYSCASMIGRNIYVIGGIRTAADPHITGRSTVYEYNPSVDLTTLVNHVSLNKCYVIPGSDNICIAAKMNDPAGVTLFAMIESLDQTCIDSLQLFDDGNHNDGDAGDSIYSNTWQAGPEEIIYYVDLKVKRVSSETIIHRMNNMASFTTIGPVAYENHSFESPPMPGESVKLELTLTNEGLTTTASGVRAKLISLDPLVTVTTENYVSFFDISPGESKAKSGYRIEVSESCPENAEIRFAIDITSEGYSFWSDTFSIVVGSPTAINQKENIPQKLFLNQNYPNPFDLTTIVQFSIPESGFVTLTVYDSFGREVGTLVNESLNAGEHSVNFDANDLIDGIYFYKLKTGDMILTGKMLLMR
jgi:N-acetylneuraminic acid mutarotase